MLKSFLNMYFLYNKRYKVTPGNVTQFFQINTHEFWQLSLSRTY